MKRKSTVRNYDPEERAREKQAARDADAAALASGAKTREQLTRENGILTVDMARPRWDLAPKSM